MILTQILKDIDSGLVETEPNRLFSFGLLTFADLKKYNFIYWFGFPALSPPTAFQNVSTTPISAVLKENQARSFRILESHVILTLQSQLADLQAAFVALKRDCVDAGISPPAVFLAQLGSFTVHVIRHRSQSHSFR
jgi:ubiquitin-like modifier-activating enzyme ATG7